MKAAMSKEQNIAKPYPEPIVTSKNYSFCWPMLLLISSMPACHASKRMPMPPAAKIIPHESTLHGDTRIDNYFWLRERTNPEVVAYLKAENKYTDRMMHNTEKLQQKLFEEMRSHIKESDASVPRKDGAYFYYQRTEKNKQYPIHCRKKESLEAKEEIILDVNVLAKGFEHFRLRGTALSPNHQILAYVADNSGAELYTLYFKDLNTGQLLADRVENTSGNIAWANDNQTIFYGTRDQARRPYKIFRHQLGTSTEEDQLVYHEKDEAFFLGVGKTRSEKYLLLSSTSSTTSEIRFLDAHRPTDTPLVIQARQHGLEYRVDHWQDRFFIVHNHNAQNFMVSQAPVSQPGIEHWQELIAHNKDIRIIYTLAFAHHLVVTERHAGVEMLRVHDLESGEDHYIDFTEAAYSVSPWRQTEFASAQLRFSYSSPITPESVFDYDMNHKTRDLKKETEVPGGYDRSRYQVARIYAQAADGTHVPITLIHRRGLKLDGSHSLLLRGYGSYGISQDASFASMRLPLLKRGFVMAIAHVRGGGEMGRPWYYEGKMLKKKNTFSDFIVCAEHLIAQGYTNKNHLAVTGGSAGGLLMGAVTNMRPDLFRTVVAKVPFVDVLNTMLDSSLPLTVHEFEEWGNPADAAFYHYIKSYSPYDNVKAGAYPDILVTAGWNDPRVQYWEPAKWVAKLRALKTDSSVLLLKTRMGAGHKGASGRYDALREMAFDFAFVMQRLGFDL